MNEFFKIVAHEYRESTALEVFGILFLLPGFLLIIGSLAIMVLGLIF